MGWWPRRRPPQIPVMDPPRTAVAWRSQSTRTGQAAHTARAVRSSSVGASVVNTARRTGSTHGAAHAAPAVHGPGGGTGCTRTRTRTGATLTRPLCREPPTKPAQATGAPPLGHAP